MLINKKNFCKDVQVVILEPNRDGRGNQWTGTGYMRTFEGSELEFDINDIKTPMEYDLVIRYSPQLPGGWNEVSIQIERLEPPDPSGPCANSEIIQDFAPISLPVDRRSITINNPICLEPGKSYKARLNFNKYDPNSDTPSASVLIDSVSTMFVFIKINDKKKKLLAPCVIPISTTCSGHI